MNALRFIKKKGSKSSLDETNGNGNNNHKSPLHINTASSYYPISPPSPPTNSPPPSLPMMMPNVAATSPGAGIGIPLSRRSSTLRRNSSAKSPDMVSRESYNSQSPAGRFLSQFASPGTISNLEDMPEIQPGDRLSDSDSNDTPSGEDIIFDKLIGNGGSSEVWKCHRDSDKEEFAVKVIHISAESDDQIQRQQHEIDIWRKLEHQNIVKLHECQATKNRVCLVMELCPNGNLLEVAKDNPDHDLVREYFYQTCLAIQYLHEEIGVCHKDIKLENLLLDTTNQVKLCDFGLSVHRSRCTDCYDDTGGTLESTAPEQLRSTKVLACPKTDVWSLGIALYTLSTGRRPFDDCSETRLRENILKGTYDDKPDQLCDDLRHLISHCLKPNPLERYSVDQILEHPWMKRKTTNKTYD